MPKAKRLQRAYFWKRRIERWLLLLTIAVLLGYLALCFSTVLDWANPESWKGIYAVFTLLSAIQVLVLLVGVIRILQYLRRSTDTSGLEPLPPSVASIFNEFARDLFTSFFPKGHRILLLYDPNDLSVLPCVTYKSTRTCLVLPLGFFKLMMREKKEALALIAHELAHIKHKDARLVLSASANYTILRYFVCSWILILPSMLYAIFLVNKEANSAIREEKLKFSQSCGLDASNYSIPCYGSVSDGLGGSLTVGPPSDVERRRLADYRKSLDGQSTLVTSVIGVFFVTVLIGPNVWILALLKKRRRRSEELADMAAVAYSDPDGVRAYLMRIQRQSTLVTRSHFWSLYPSVDRRLALVEKWARL